ncbi:MAG: hotdog domain-containing protein [Bacteroidota bacterium]
MESKYFQDHLVGNVCFGCGRENEAGLQISSFWEGEEAVCYWESEEKYQGWKGIMNGGILATLIDCHTMNTAMAAAYAAEDRALDSQPVYRYATGTITVKYLRPTPNDQPVELRATVTEIKGRKVRLNCIVKSKDIVTAEAQVIAIRVFDSSEEKHGVFGG